MKSEETSYPRDRIRVLLLENVGETAVAGFARGGYAAGVERLSRALGEDELAEAVRGVHILGIRSKTKITERVLASADRLLAIGCFCIGVNQVDLSAATGAGVAVFNAPYSNTRSVAEMVIGLSVMLIRRVADKNAAAHRGVWLKEAKGSYELRGKTLGIVGYGNIGSQVSVMAEALGMKVVYHDIVPKLPHGNARQARDLAELLAESDIVTLHVPGGASTRNLMDERTLAQMRRGALLINYSRGDVVDLQALRSGIESGALGGAAVDVFPEEPERNGDAFKCVLQNLPNVILTPHVGGSTEEAQAGIGLDVSSKLIQYLEFGTSTGSHTVPPVSLPPQEGTHRILHIHRNVPGVLGEINSELSGRGVNILGQYLKTNDRVGYVILDVDTALSGEAVRILKSAKATLKTRVVY
ncbi:MAG: D-3-phosphoglycerate dehydrogenase / 2-oxoglutarate reductase [Acidobacteriota bacterium]|jgi:D-3-phosphoglycerate dehydrogenase|nr:D-3-phosphoglycerate dehydrogenase / 2-oxoglutarate reductase [Acidobacteriota bacterium]